MKATIAIVSSLVIGLTLGFVAPAISTDNEEAGIVVAKEGDTEIMVCVDWETKEMRHSKYWEECPPRHTEKTLGIQGPEGPQGPQGEQGPRGFSGSGGRGPQGETTSLWDSLDSCHKKLDAAIAAGYQMYLKSDRNEFESSTGCTVENILNQDFIDTVRDIGLPVITSVEYVSTSGGEGEDFTFGEVTAETFRGNTVTYRVQIANYDSYSNSGSGSRYQYCLADEDTQGDGGKGYSPGQLVEVGNGEFTMLRYLRATPFESDTFRVEFNLGYVTNSGCQPLNFWTGYSMDFVERPMFIYEDPERYLGTDKYQGALSYWGWR